MPNKNPYFVFDTHPIQYRSPVFRALKEKAGVRFFYFNEQFDGKKWWFAEYNKIPKQKWNLNLQNGIEAETVHTKQLGYWQSFQKLRRLIQDRPPAALIFGWFLPEHWMLWVLCAYYRVPLVFVGETYTLGSSRVRIWLKKVLHPLFFSKVAQVLAIGEKSKKFYEQLSLPKEKITEAKYCIDTQFFSLPIQESLQLRDSVRADHGIESDKFVILFVGRLFERKRPFDLIELAKRLSGLTSVQIVVVGNGPLKKELRQKSTTLKNITLLGFQDQHGVRELYHASDLLFVPSEYETWGLVVNEAFACRLPAVVTESCGVADDLLIPGENGESFAVGNIDEAAKKIRPIVESSLYHQRLRFGAYRRVSAYFGVSEFAHKMQIALEKASSAQGQREGDQRRLLGVFQSDTTRVPLHNKPSDR